MPFTSKYRGIVEAVYSAVRWPGGRVTWWPGGQVARWFDSQETRWSDSKVVSLVPRVGEEEEDCSQFSW